MQTKNIPSVVSVTRSLGHYKWGNNCDAWKLVDNKDLGVKVERMSPHSEETLHYHKHSQQFFFILQGRAVFDVDGVILIVHKGEGIQIEAERLHRIMNKEDETLEFLVCSQPAITSDRHTVV